MKKILLCFLLVALLAMAHADDVSDTVAAAFQDLGGTSSGLSGGDIIADAEQLFNEAPAVDSPVIEVMDGGVVIFSMANFNDTSGFGKNNKEAIDSTSYKTLFPVF